MNHKSKPVTISATGQTLSGRTTILAIIHKALLDAGFTSVIYENPEETTRRRFEMVEELKENPDPEFLAKSITLVEVHVPRHHK